MSYGHREGLIDFAMGGGDGTMAHREGGILGVAGEQRASSSLTNPSPRLPRICIPNIYFVPCYISRAELG